MPEDRDQGFSQIMANLRKLRDVVVETGVHASEGSHMTYIAGLNEFGSQEWVVTSKQAYFMARYLMKIDPDAGPEEKARFWGAYRTLVGKTMRIPERSYMRATFDAHQAKFDKAIARVLQVALDGGDVEEALQQFALFTQTMFRRGLMAATPVNAPLTIAVKGSDQPLVDTGRLRASIIAIVWRGGVRQYKGRRGALVARAKGGAE